MQALDASYVVEGSVQAVSNRLRVTLNLVRHDQSVAWGRTLEAPASDLFDLQEQLASMLSAALEEQTASGQPPKIAAPPTSNEPAQIAYWKGRAYLDRRDLTGNQQAALKEFENAVAADPKFALAYAGLAEAQWSIYASTNDKTFAQKAVESTTKALELEPDRSVVRYTAALTLFRSGRYDEAQTEAGRAIALQSNYEDAIRLLGRVLMRQNQIEAGLEQFKKAAVIRPSSVSLYTDMGLALFGASRFTEALEALEKAIQLSPNSSRILSQAGAASQAMGDNTRALDYYQRANAIQPLAETFSNMGTIYYSLGEYDQAANAYEGAILIRPLGTITHRNLGDAYLHLNRQADALKAYRQAVALAEAEVSVSPNDARAIARLAVYQAKAGDDRAARASVERALNLAADDGQVHQRAAVVHALAGRAPQALDEIQKAIAGGIARRTIAAEGDFEKLRPLPRFAAMVANPAEVKR